jgi:hypothetical protein
MEERLDVVTALVYLPRYYNPDEHGRRKPVEDWKFESTAEEIAKAFGGGTLYRPPEDSLTGFWWVRGFVEKDVLALLEVDIPDAPQNREWLKTYAKEVLLKRFRQEAIYIKFVGSIDRTLVTLEEATLQEDEVAAPAVRTNPLIRLWKSILRRTMSWLERRRLRRQ